MEEEGTGSRAQQSSKPDQHCVPGTDALGHRYPPEVVDDSNAATYTYGQLKRRSGPIVATLSIDWKVI
ncbi:MAG: hypothetical protein ACYC0L_04635 [Thermoleophilia bacterium]